MREDKIRSLISKILHNNGHCAHLALFYCGWRIKSIFLQWDLRKLWQEGKQLIKIISWESHWVTNAIIQQMWPTRKYTFEPRQVHRYHTFITVYKFRGVILLPFPAKWWQTYAEVIRGKCKMYLQLETWEMHLMMLGFSILMVIRQELIHSQEITTE